MTARIATLVAVAGAALLVGALGVGLALVVRRP